MKSGGHYSGFVVQLAFGAAVFAGQAISMTMGLGFAMAVDPQNGVQVPVLSQLYVILATLLFLSLDGHLVLIAAVIGVLSTHTGWCDWNPGN